MAKINLSNVLTLIGINNNFQKIEDELNNKVLYRNNPVGEPNTMESSLDMNGERIFNLPAPGEANEAARLQDVQNAIGNQAQANLTAFAPYKRITANNVQGAIQQVVDSIAVSPMDFGADKTGVADSSTAIQAAHDSLPASGGEIYFPPGTYKFSGIIITKSVSIRCAGGFNGGVIWTNPTPTTPFFSATSISAFLASGFHATSSVTRTGGKYFDLTTINRVSITEFFAEKYYVCIGVDGGSEIKIDTFQMFDGVSGALFPNSGAILLGDNNYTGSTGIDNGYIKCQDLTKQCSFGIRAKFVDVMNIGANVTIIGHGTNLDISPGNGQTASFVKSWGTTYDTAVIGVNIAPTGTGRVIRADFYGGWYGEHTITGIVVDGTSGTVDGVLFHGGEAMNNLSVGVNIFGANSKNIKVMDMDVSGNPIGIRFSTSADGRIEGNTIGVSGAAGGNTAGIAVDSTVVGLVSRNRFTGNGTNISGTPGTNLSVFDNSGIDSNWIDFTPSVTSETGALAAVSATGRFRKTYQTVHFEMTIIITNNGTGATSILATLPIAARVASAGTGRAIGISGKMLQAFVGGASSSLRIANFDGSYPAASGEILVVSGSYEIT